MDRTGGWQLSLQDWEQIFQDFKGRNKAKWLSQYPGLAMLEQALYIVAKKDYPFKPQLLAFIEENIEVLIGDDDTEEGLGSVVEALRTVLETPSLLKEQMMTTATVALILLDSLHRALHQLQMLVEVLLGVINRPNHVLDRQARGTACECLRELEKAYPCLLHSCAGHILSLFHSERTHVAQSYTLLLTTILHNLACYMYTTPGSRSGGTSSMLTTSAPLTPFIVPSFLVTSDPGEEALSVPSRELTPTILKEFRKVVGVLLERPQLLTSSAMLEFVSSLIDIAAALELQGSILKVQLYNLMYTYNPLLCHVVLMVYFHFSESFKGDEGAIFKRLCLLCKDSQQPLMIRLLAVHWLFGLENLIRSKDRNSLLASMAGSLYPLIYDPLSLKALKLDALALCAACILSPEGVPEGNHSDGPSQGHLYKKEDGASKLFMDGAVCLSSFRWLPSWSSEMQLMFRMFYRFLTLEVKSAGSSDGAEIFSRTLFKTIQDQLVSLALQLRRLVPCLLFLVDKLLLCKTHNVLGQHLLQVFNRDLLSRVAADKRLPAYFPLLERIAENGSIPPGEIVDLLFLYTKDQVSSAGSESLLWIRGSQVLLICRIIMVYHYSSRAFHSLRNLLAFLVFYFPDIDVQDNARTFLRMLTSIPGTKLRAILKYGDEGIEDPQFSQVPSLLQTPSPSIRYKLLPPVSSYIHFNRTTSLLVGQSWSIVLHDLFESSGKVEEDNGIVVLANEAGLDTEGKSSMKEDNGIIVLANEAGLDTEGKSSVKEYGDHEEASPQPDGTTREEKKDLPEEAKLLQEYFSIIPDYVNGSGLKVKVQCYLTFRAVADSPRSIHSGPSFSESWPALYAVVLSFSTSGPYGSIPSVHIPFLMSEPLDNIKRTASKAEEDSLSEQLRMVQHQLESDAREGDAKPLMGRDAEGDDPEGNKPEPEDKDGSSSQDEIAKDEFREPIMLVLEPKQPVPTIIDTFILSSDEQGRQIQGQLDSIHVGIEDLFGKACTPPSVSSSDAPMYCFTLFNSLWAAFDRTGSLSGESFDLQGGNERISVVGTESVKLLESRADRVVDAVERCLAPFVVSAKGNQLMSILQDSGILKDIVWQDDAQQTSSRASHLAIAYRGPDDVDGGSDQLNDYRGQLGGMPVPEAARDNIGSLCIMIFLPPRFHVLFKLGVADWSTLVHIRTDHWPCLAYVDEYLEALVASH